MKRMKPFLPVRSGAVLVVVALVASFHSTKSATAACWEPPSAASLLGPTMDWRAQDHKYNQGVRAVHYDTDQECLTAECAMVGQHLNYAKGEMVLDLKYVYGLESSVPVDMSNRTITMEIEIPPEFIGPAWAPNGVQVAVKDDKFRSQYGSWINCTRAGTVVAELAPSLVTPPWGYTDAGFNPSQIRVLLVKFAINDASQMRFTGQINVKKVTINPPLLFTEPPDLPPTLPQPHIHASATMTLRPDGFYFDGRKSFIVGGNWRIIEYGQNFGTTGWFPWGNGVSKHRGFVATRLPIFRQAGVTVVRVGLLDDGRSVLDRDGSVVGFNQTFRADVATLLDLAAQNNIRVEFVLIDYLIAGKPEEVDGVWVRGRGNVIEDVQVRAGFVQNFLDPFLSEFGKYPSIFGFDIINEPEWIVSLADGGGWETVKDLSYKAVRPVSGQSLQDFIKLCVSRIRVHAPGKPVTVGVSCKYLGLSKGLGLDYLAPHFYPWMGDLSENLSQIPRDKVWMIEEFPGKEDLSVYFNTTYEHGASGVLLWNLSPGIDDQAPTFQQETRKLQQIRQFVDKLDITPGPIGDFCGPSFGPPDGYVDVWDLMHFADHWHTSPGDNWDPKFDLTGPSFSDPDGYIDVWDLMVFADHWHEGEPP